MTFADRLKELRLERELSQAEVGILAGVDKSTVGKWEQINTIPSIDVLKRLALCFNITLDYLLGYSDTRSLENFDNVVDDYDIALLKALRGLKKSDKDILLALAERLAKPH